MQVMHDPSFLANKGLVVGDVKRLYLSEKMLIWCWKRRGDCAGHFCSYFSWGEFTYKRSMVMKSNGCHGRWEAETSLSAEVTPLHALLSQS